MNENIIDLVRQFNWYLTSISKDYNVEFVETLNDRIHITILGDVEPTSVSKHYSKRFKQFINYRNPDIVSNYKYGYVDINDTRLKLVWSARETKEWISCHMLMEGSHFKNMSYLLTALGTILHGNFHAGARTRVIKLPTGESAYFPFQDKTGAIEVITYNSTNFMVDLLKYIHNDVYGQLDLELKIHPLLNDNPGFGLDIYSFVHSIRGFALSLYDNNLYYVSMLKNILGPLQLLNMIKNELVEKCDDPEIIRLLEMKLYS